MTSLQTLWDASLTLCAIGSLSLAALLLARVIARGQSQRRAEARGRLLPKLLGDGDIPCKLTGLDLKAAAGLTCELAELTRGSDLDALLERAEAMGVPAVLAQWLKAGSPQKRLSAVETLGLFARDGILVAAALDDRNRDVRLGAALILAGRDDGPAVTTLLRKLRIGIDEHSLLIVSLMTDLAARDPDAVAALLFAKDVPHQAKVAAIEALAVSGSQHTPLLALMAQDSRHAPQLQQTLYRALGRAEHPAGASAILEGMASEDASVRAAAAEAAGKAGLSQASDTLGVLLGDTHWAVRFHAAAALLRLGQIGRQTLMQAADGDENDARHAARKMLAEARVA